MVKFVKYLHPGFYALLSIWKLAQLTVTNINGRPLEIILSGDPRFGEKASVPTVLAKCM